jgi:hypothetical protein
MIRINALKRLILFTIFLLLTIPLFAQESDSMPQFFYTNHQATGNRFIEGIGTFPNVAVYDSEFSIENSPPQTPVWLVGASGENPSWYIVSANNAPGVLSLTADGIRFDLLTSVASATKPPVLDTRGRWLPTTANDESYFTNPVPLTWNWLYISYEGDLVLSRDYTELDRLALNIQADARIVVSDDGRIAVYAEASQQRYVHGIMGDDLEGSTLVVLRVNNDVFETVARVDLEGDAIYEGLSPMWADVDEDGTQDLITTVSDSQTGSRIRVYLFTADGIRQIDGQAIGQAYRWQHQLAWGALGAKGEMELVDVRTPHIGGIVRFYQFTGNSLEIVATQTGYTSHVINSRNLDMAVAGDFNGDGQPEIIVPSQNRGSIAGIQHTADGAKVMWELPLDGILSSNLAALQLADGHLALAVGTEEGRLRIWVSQ